MDKPILCSAPMVRALLDGSKTQTRRVLAGKSGITPAHRVERAGQSWLACEYDRRWPLRLPYAPGDRLWVKETWSTLAGFDPLPPRDIKPGAPIDYHAGGGVTAGGKTRVSIFMPRWASRITLIVTDVRVERLRGISRGDAMDEGCPFANIADGPDPRDWYRDLWDSLNGDKPGCAWEANPWVTALTLTVHQTNIDQMEASDAE